MPIRLRCIHLPTAGCKGTEIVTVPAIIVAPRGNRKIAASRRRRAKMVRTARGR